MPTTDGDREKVRAEARAAFDGDDVPRKNRALRWVSDALESQAAEIKKLRANDRLISWRGRLIRDMPREELLEVVEELGGMFLATQQQVIKDAPLVAAGKAASWRAGKKD